MLIVAFGLSIFRVNSWCNFQMKDSPEEIRKGELKTEEMKELSNEVGAHMKGKDVTKIEKDTEKEKRTEEEISMKNDNGEVEERSHLFKMVNLPAKYTRMLKDTCLEKGSVSI